MIVLDTNVLSELTRSEPAAAVFARVSARPRATLYTTSVSKAEILYGIAVLPEGRRAGDARRGGDLGVEGLDRAALEVVGEHRFGRRHKRPTAPGLRPATPGFRGLRPRRNQPLGSDVKRAAVSWGICRT